MSKIAKPKQRKSTSSVRSVQVAQKSKPAKAASAPRPSSATRETSKLAAMIALLRRKEGATLEQMMKATDWQAHSVRGAMSGALKKKRGLTITSAKDGTTRTYHITDAD